MRLHHHIILRPIEHCAPQHHNLAQAVVAERVEAHVILRCVDDILQAGLQLPEIRRPDFALKDTILGAAAVAGHDLHHLGPPLIIGNVIAHYHPLPAITGRLPNLHVTYPFTVSCTAVGSAYRPSTSATPAAYAYQRRAELELLRKNPAAAHTHACEAIYTDEALSMTHWVKTINQWLKSLEQNPEGLHC